MNHSSAFTTMKTRYVINAYRQHGFSLIAAIFLLVIIAALGAFMIHIYQSQQSMSNMDVQGVRAYYSAKAGLERSMYAILSVEQMANSTPATCASPNVSGSVPMVGANTNFMVDVTCNMTQTTESTNVIRVYQLTAKATFGSAVLITGQPSQDYVERSVSTTITTCRQGLSNAAVC